MPGRTRGLRGRRRRRRWGTLFQCSSEEAEELRIGMAGFTSYAETVSVYGTEKSFRRRRRHALVQGVSRGGLCLARHQDALHVGGRGPNC
jgi:hypothetical protein